MMKSRSGLAALARLMSSSPSYPGIRMSVMIRSGRSVSTSSSASIPLCATPATSISSDAQSTRLQMSWQTFASSSATMTFIIRLSSPKTAIPFHTKFILSASLRIVNPTKSAFFFSCKIKAAKKKCA